MTSPEFFHILIYTAIATVLIGVLIVAASWLGAKRKSFMKGMSYESGVTPSGTARLAWPVPFYLVAIFFIVFDVEAAFIFAWAVAWDELGLPGLIQISVFILILFAGLIWLLNKGALDWGPSAENRKYPHV